MHCTICHPSGWRDFQWGLLWSTVIRSHTITHVTLSIYKIVNIVIQYLVLKPLHLCSCLEWSTEWFHPGKQRTGCSGWSPGLCHCVVGQCLLDAPLPAETVNGDRADLEVWFCIIRISFPNVIHEIQSTSLPIYQRPTSPLFWSESSHSVSLWLSLTALFHIDELPTKVNTHTQKEVRPHCTLGSSSQLQGFCRISECHISFKRNRNVYY